MKITEYNKYNKELAEAIKQYPEILKWLGEKLSNELERLPYAVNNTGVYQGRCQMLMELIDFLNKCC